MSMAELVAGDRSVRLVRNRRGDLLACGRARMLTLRVPTVHISCATLARRQRCCRDVLQLTYGLTALSAAV
jgi:hypothetical protein